MLFGEHSPRSGPLGADATPSLPEAVETDVLALPFLGRPTGVLERVDRALEGRLDPAATSADRRARAGAIELIRTPAGAAAARVALVGAGGPGEFDLDTLRAAAAAAARAAVQEGGRLVWAFEPEVPVSPEEQVRAVVEGAILGAHDPGRWRAKRAAALEQVTVAGVPEGLEPAVARAAVIARWTNRARELVDAPANEMTPHGLGQAASALLAPFGVEVTLYSGAALEQLALPALRAVGQGSVNAPCLIVARYRGREGGETLGLVGKGITYDSGGFFLKPQGDLVRQKADMGGGAAVIAAAGAIAELGLPVDLVAVVPAAENMIGGAAFRPGDIIDTAAGLTVEITNPDAEGRLVLADGLWFAQQHGARRLIDVATLTGAVRAGMGDLFAGVFANDDDWRDAVVAAGSASGDYAWPWPLHRRYRPLVESSLADLRNTAGRTFGYPVIAATFLERFVDGVPWAHIDIHSTAFADEARDYFQPGATGAGVRLLIETVRAL
jgi:leucyl aminopeptidase